MFMPISCSTKLQDLTFPCGKNGQTEDGILFEQRVGWAPFYQQFYNMTATWTRPEVSCFGWENTHHGHMIGREHLMGRLDQSTEKRDTVIYLLLL